MITRWTGDFRLAGRALRKNIGFTITTILLLSAVIGGSVFVFTVLDAVLLRELPISHPEEFARIVTIEHNRPPIADENPWGVYEQWRYRSRSFRISFAKAELGVLLSEGASVQVIRAEIVTGDYFTVLDVRPALGRLLTRQDEWALGSSTPVVLGYGFWKRHFAEDPHVLGRVLHLDGQPFVVIGVTPRDFGGISVDTGPDLRVPFIAGRLLMPEWPKWSESRQCCFWEIAGRIRPGITPAQAQAETDASLRAAWEAWSSQRRPLTEQDRRWLQGRVYRIEKSERGVSWLRQRFTTGIVALMGAVVLLLILVCANVAGLLLARAAEREQETAIRLALGANRRDVMRQWFAESTLLALLAGFGGLLITRAALPYLDAVLPPMRNLLTQRLPVTLDVVLNIRAFGFAVLLCVGAAILIGLTPACYARQSDLTTSLKSMATDPRRSRLRLLLVGGQAAICTMILTNAGLLVETLRNLDRLNPGFDPDHVITFTIDTGLEHFTAEQRRAFAIGLMRDARILPGVSSAAIAARALMRGGGMKETFGPAGSRIPATDVLNTDVNTVSPGYFETMGMHLLAGRTYDDRDLSGGKPALSVVNQSFVKRFFPNRHPIGEYFGDAGGGIVQPDIEIIGVVADAKYRSLRERTVPEVFACLCGPTMLQDTFFQLEVRTYGNSESVIPAVEALLNRAGARLGVREIHTLREDVDDSLWTERTMANVASLFSIAGLLLTAIGLYGLIVYTFTRRRREIGIRLALGARSSDIVRAITTGPFMFIAAGVACGSGASIIMGQFLRTLLYGVSPFDPWTKMFGASLIVATAFIASIPSVLLAARLDASKALRDTC